MVSLNWQIIDLQKIHRTHNHTTINVIKYIISD
jgi:hypothetical protein